MSIDIYYSYLSPPSRAVLMTGKQLGIQLNVKNIDLSKGEHLTHEYLKLNPSHTVPTIVDGDLVLWESRAIIQYLCNKFSVEGTLYPKGLKERALVDRWLNTDSSYFIALRDALVFPIVKSVEPTENGIQNYKNSLKLIDSLIGNNKFLAGEHLTIADISVLATTTLLSINDYKDLKDYPNLKKWYESVQKVLPYFDEVNGKVGKGFKQFRANKK